MNVAYFLKAFKKENHEQRVCSAIRCNCLVPLTYLLEIEDVLVQSHLMVAIEAQEVEMMKHLVSLGLKVSFDALVPASKLSSLAMMKALVELGADIELKDICGMTPFVHAIRNIGAHSVVEMVKFFLENGADARSVDNFGYTTLMACAVRKSCRALPEVMTLLLKHGADERVRGHCGRNLKELLQSLNRYNAFAPILKSVRIWRQKQSFAEVCTTFVDVRFGKLRLKPVSHPSFLEVNVDILHNVFSFL